MRRTLNDGYAVRAAELLELLAPTFPPQDALVLEACAKQLRQSVFDRELLARTYALLSQRIAEEEEPSAGGQAGVKEDKQESERRLRQAERESIRIVALLLQGMRRGQEMGGMEIC